MAKSNLTPNATAVPGTIGVSGVDMDDLDSLLASLEVPQPVQPAPVAVVEAVAELNVLDDAMPTQAKKKSKTQVAPVMEVTKDANGFVTMSASLQPVATVDPFLSSIEEIANKPEFLNIVVYGRTGTGKSTFAGQGDKTLVLELEPDGTFSVASSQIKLKGKKKRIRSWADMEETYWWIKKHPGVFNAVVFDTVSRMVEVCTKSVLIDKETADFTLTKDVWKVSLAQRGDVAQRMIFWMEAYRDLPLHKIWLAQETTGSGEEAGVGDYSTYPDMQRKPRAFLLGDATIVGRMEIRMAPNTDGTESPKYCLVVGADANVYTKDRTNALGKGMVNPTLEKILTKVYGTKGVQA